VNSSVFNVFLNSARDVEEQTASGKLFQSEVAAAEKPLAPMVVRQVCEITKTVEDEYEEWCRCHSLMCVNIGDLRQLSRQVLGAVKAVLGEYRQPKYSQQPATNEDTAAAADVVCVLYSLSQKSDAIEDYSITYVNFHPIKHDFASV